MIGLGFVRRTHLGRQRKITMRTAFQASFQTQISARKSISDGDVQGRYGRSLCELLCCSFYRWLDLWGRQHFLVLLQVALLILGLRIFGGMMNGEEH